MQSVCEDEVALGSQHHPASAATPSEQKEALKWWRGNIEGGPADDHLRECEAERLQLGLTVTLAAYKPGEKWIWDCQLSKHFVIDC